jgi:mannosyltransferase
MAAQLRTRLAHADRDPWIAALTAFVVSGALIWRPSYWYDEAATISVANRSLPDMLRLLLNVDAVHGLYYLAMHAWFSIVPMNEFTARLPSAFAVGIGAAGMIVLGKLIADRRFAWVAAVVFTLLPRTLWSAVEARSYAVTAALAVWLTVVLVVSVQRRSAVMWCVYAGLLALSIVTFIYLCLLAVAHAVTLFIRPQTRPTLRAFTPAAVCGLVLALPLVVLAISQKSRELGFMSASLQRSVLRSVVLEWFPSARLSAGACILVVVAGLVVSLRTRRQLGCPVAIAIPWFVVPTLVLVTYSTTVENIYGPRYLTFTAPGVALLLAAAVTAIASGRRQIIAAMLVLLSLASLGAFVNQRGTYAKPIDADYSAVANVIAAHAKPGDCVAFDVSPEGFALRAVAAARPEAFADLRDVRAGASSVELADFWTQDLPLDSGTVTKRMTECSALWTVIARDAHPMLIDVATRQSFVVDRQWVLGEDRVLLLRRH